MGLSAGDKEEGGTNGEDEEDEVSAPKVVSNEVWSSVAPGGRGSGGNESESIEMLGERQSGLELLDAAGLGKTCMRDAEAFVKDSIWLFVQCRRERSAGETVSLHAHAIILLRAADAD